MEEYANFGLEQLEKSDVSYGDIRFSDIGQEVIVVKNGSVESIKDSKSKGYGIRVIDGGWGFASSSDISKDGIKKTVERAIKIARASAKASNEPKMKDIEIFQDEYKNDYKKDPFNVSTEEKLEILTEAEKRMRVDDKVKVTQASFRAWDFDKIFKSTEGADIHQKLIQCGGGISANATDGEDVQKRSYPNSFGGDFHSEGFEFFESLDLIGEAKRVGEEAVKLLDADQCPSGNMDIILDTSQLALQIHESCGHPTELDRVLGTEASYAGTSFLTPDKLNELRYGSDIVHLTSDATAENGLGTFGYDDEGVKAKKVDLVKDGIFVGYQASREDAAQIDVPVSGNMRADGWQNLPIVRMTNIDLEPGDWSRKEIIEDSKEAILMDTIKSWSIDDKRLNFQFGTEAGYLIKNGEIKKLIKNPTYTGITYKFWRNCDAIAGKDDWKMHGVPNCGKGEPAQTMRTGHGCAPSRFRDIRVGVGKW